MHKFMLYLVSLHLGLTFFGVHKYLLRHADIMIWALLFSFVWLYIVNVCLRVFFQGEFEEANGTIKFFERKIPFSLYYPLAVLGLITAFAHFNFLQTFSVFATPLITLTCLNDSAVLLKVATRHLLVTGLGTMKPRRRKPEPKKRVMKATQLFKLKCPLYT